MKKTYIKPTLMMADTELDTMICVSEYIYSDFEIDYGGIDVGGLKDPASNIYHGVWGEEEKEI